MMAVKVVWVLCAIWSVRGLPEPHYSSFASPDECKAAALKAMEYSGAQFAFCTEGYAAPLQYLPYER